MISSTKTSQKDIRRTWHLVDVKDQILGRISSHIAKLLIGKTKPYFVSHLDCGDFVVIINAKMIKVSGNKAKQKEYSHFSGYPGGLKKLTFNKVLQENPTRIIHQAVSGMLPKNKLRDLMLKRLFIYADDKHPYAEKLENQSA